MWNSSLRRSTCSGVRPEKQNMPIWVVMCDQSRVEPRAVSREQTRGGRTELLEVLDEEGAHEDDAVGHDLDLLAPELLYRDEGGGEEGSAYSEGGVLEDGLNDAAAVDGGVGVHGADEDEELGQELLLLLLALADDVEGTDALAVESKVLGERLADSDLGGKKDGSENKERTSWPS